VAGVRTIPWRYWLPGRIWRVVATVIEADEVPSRLPPNAAVLVGSSAQPKWLAFDCPCRSGHRILANLDSNRYPCWQVLGRNRLSVWPSFDVHQAGRRCHYLILHGRTLWVPEKERMS